MIKYSIIDLRTKKYIKQNGRIIIIIIHPVKLRTIEIANKWHRKRINAIGLSTLSSTVNLKLFDRLEKVIPPRSTMVAQKKMAVASLSKYSRRNSFVVIMTLFFLFIMRLPFSRT